MEHYVTKNQKTLRCGITTGTCAAAAAEAAAAALLLHIRKETVQVQTPKGITVQVPVRLTAENGQLAEYYVVKDSGDDPDVTNHARICVRVERAGEDTYIAEHVFRDERYPNLFLDGGPGVGRVTKEGLEQETGQAAINIVPRSMIFEAVGEICKLAEYTERLLVIVHVPEGEELARHTFNPNLGITGGISILGTTGILEPMSEKAIIDTIETEIRQQKAQGRTSLLITPGNYGQHYASAYLHLALEKSVKCSNYIGETIDLAVSYGMSRLLLVGNIGKLVKLAAGIMNTHSRVADGRAEIMAVHAVLCGASRETAVAITECINTEQMLGILEKENLLPQVCESLCRKIHSHLQHRTQGKLTFGVILFSEKYGYLAQTQDAGAVLEGMREETTL